MQTKDSRKIIVAVAPVGREIAPPMVNPVTPQAVAAEVIACTQAGAGMVHLHVRDQQGEPTEDLTAFSHTLDLIRQGSDIIIQGSTGGLTRLTLEERCVALNDPRTEVASLNMGSTNFLDDVYINKMPDIRFWARRMEETRVAPEVEIFAAGMLPAYQRLVGEGVLKPPYSINICLGFKWALPATIETLFYIRSMLPEKEVPWGLIHDGMEDFALLAAAIGMGASCVRVGFEDSVFYAPGRSAATNAELVERAVSLIRQIGYEVASCDEAREILRINAP
jgi:3-keto-5-aminohexanoate cleavage enzyme